NNGNVIGATPAIGKVGQGLDFDGVGDYVKVEDSSSLDITDNITITAWIYVTKDTNNPIVTKLTEGSNPYRFMWDSDERLAFQADFDGVWVSTHRSSVWLDFNEWYHAVVTYSGAEIVFYANGNAITTINETGVLTSNNEPVEIGKSTTNSYNFNGLIDEVRVYNRALSADEIGELYRAGAKRLGVNTTQVNKLTDGLVGHWTFNGADMDWASTTAEALDRSGNSNNGNVIGAKAAIGKVGQGMEFDGVDDYVDVPDADSLDATNVTLSAWVKSGTVGRYIIAKDPPGLINSKSQITNNNNQNIFEKTFDFVKQKIVDFVNGTRKVLSWFGATIITEDEFKEIYKNVYGYDLVPWQKADGTDMSPLVAVLDDNNEQVIKPNGKPLLERSNLIPQWEQEFNNNKEKGELNKVLEELKDNTPSKFNLALSGKLFFAGIINKFFNAIAEIVLAAVEVSDTFTEASDTALESHTPDTGTGYTEVIDTGTCALWIYTSVDRLSGSASNSFGSCFSGQGSLCSEDTALSSANYEVSVLQQDGDTGDDTNTIACRIQDVNNMYAVRFNEDASDLYKRTTANGWETIDTSGGGIADGSTVKLICDGTSISVEDDDVEILSATDSSHAAAGKAGIGMGTVMVAGDDCSSQDLDNFTVNTLPASGKSSVPYALSTVGGGQFLIMNSGTTYTATSTTDINDNEWHHIVGSYDGTTMKVYIDGVLEDTNTDFSGNLPTNSGNVRIGADYQTTAANFFDGLIDEARIYNRALSADEIGELYRAGARKMRLKR
ncbi:LamG domain-containing protein, partial [Candidatus Parcubacteria bacterium]|nr:LamG domain-containing protein [Candidatus Parcubacteria bacterium]